MTVPGAVLFDCDGVLVDSEPVTNRLLRDDLARRGLDLPLEQILEISTGSTMERIAEEAVRHGADIPQDWVQLFYAQMFLALEKEVEAIPGVSDLINDLIVAGVARAVASNGPVAKMEITLARTGLIDSFAPHIYSARDLKNPKPAPDIYLHAAAQLGVAPDGCVVVEDSASGARAAGAAGMRCIGFSADGPGAHLVPLCDIVVSDMAGVARALGL